MRTGIIDLGTNSLRFSFWEISPTSRRAALIYRKKTMILPGEDVFTTGKIPPKSLKKILKTLHSFEDKAEILNVDSVVAMATCALREAVNSDAILKAVYAQTTVPLKVISGKREAELIAQGVLKAEPQILGARILVDIGGGSTEVSLVHQRKILKSVSLPLGAQRLYQLFPELMQGPATELRLQMAEDIRAYVLKQLKKSCSDWPIDKASVVLGSSGTIRNLGRLITRKRAATQSRLAWIRQVSAPSKTRPKFAASELKSLNQSLLFLTPRQLETLAGVEPERRPLLVHGALLLEEILNFFSIKSVHATEGSLRDGVLFELTQGLLKPDRLRALNPALKKRRKKKTKLKVKKLKKLKKILKKLVKPTRKKA